MSSHECPCPNMWVSERTRSYFILEEKLGVDTGVTKQGNVSPREKLRYCRLHLHQCNVMRKISSWARWDWGRVEQLQQGSVPLRFPRGQLFSRSFPCFPSALRQSRHSLRTFRHHLDQWDWRLLTGPQSYYKAITTPPPPPPPPRHLSSPASRSPLICQ